MAVKVPYFPWLQPNRNFVVNGTLQLASDQSVTSLACTGPFLYAGIDTSPAQIVTINTHAFTPSTIDTLQLVDYPNQDRISALLLYQFFLLAGINTIPVQIATIDISNGIPYQNVWPEILDPGDMGVTCLLNTGGNTGYLYAGLMGKIFRMDANGTRSTLPLSNGGEVKALVSDGTNLYAGCLSMPSNTCTIIRIPIDTFTEDVTIPLNTDVQWINALAIMGTSLYAGVGTTTPGKLIKIDLLDFTGYSSLQLSADPMRVLSLAGSDNYLFAGTATGQLYQINTANNVVVSTINLPATGVTALAIRHFNYFTHFFAGFEVYAACHQSPGMVFRLNRPWFM